MEKRGQKITDEGAYHRLAEFTTGAVSFPFYRPGSLLLLLFLLLLPLHPFPLPRPLLVSSPLLFLFGRVLLV